MDQSKALRGLLDASDLVAMIEDLLGPQSLERLSPASLSGVRLTLRNLREGILQSHDTLAGDIMQRGRPRTDTTLSPQVTIATTSTSSSTDSSVTPVRRRDLRSTLDRAPDRTEV